MIQDMITEEMQERNLVLRTLLTAVLEDVEYRLIIEMLIF